MLNRAAARALLAVLVLLFFAPACRAVDRSENPMPATYRLYFGTYTRKEGSRGIYRALLDTASGRITEPQLAGEAGNPSFLALHPGGKFLYAVGEDGSFEKEQAGSVSAFAIQADTGDLKLINRQSSKGKHPCHINVDASGTHALVANYTGGNVVSLPIAADGSLGAAVSVVQHKGSSVHPQRQKQPHAHSVDLVAGDRFAVAADLGIDQVLLYRYAAGKLAFASSAALPPGSGPRHTAMHPDGQTLYVINELNSTMTAMRFDAQAGVLKPFQTVSTLPLGDVVPGNSTAELACHPNGRFVFGSNRGHNSLVTYAVQADTRELLLVAHTPTGGKTPRHFALDPTGRFLLALNQDSDTVSVFRVDSETGALTPTGQVLKAPTPVCVRFQALPATR
jgi:6-phosphogluconolactonase